MPIFKSSFPSIPIPEVDIYTHLFINKNKFTRDIPTSAPALIDAPTGQIITRGQLMRDTRRLAAGLRDKLGIKKGSIVLTFSTNQIDYPVVIFGILATGAACSSANAAYTAPELAHQIKDSNPSYAIVHPDLLSVALEAGKMSGLGKDKIFVFGDKVVDGVKPYSTLMSEREYLSSGIEPDDLAFLSYSSGTTSLPKGVILTHRNIVSNLCQFIAFEKDTLNSKDVFISFLPFYHIYGLVNCVCLASYLGTPSVVVPKFEFEAVLSYIQKYKVTVFMLVPPVCVLLAKSPIVDKYDLSTLRMINSGAAPLSKDLIVAVFNRIGIPVRQGYGMTETSPITHILPLDKWRVFGSIGLLIPNLEAKFVDEDGRELGVNKDGEMCVRGPNIMKCYLNNPEATRKTIDADGFLHTGDVGYIDENGYYFIVDRVKELIKYKGSQVPPAELEALLLTNSNILDCAVIGVYDADQATELPRAYVVPRGEGTPQLAAELEAFVAARVAQHKKLRGGVRFIKEVPKSASGKILRRVLKDLEKKEKSVKAKL